MKIRVGLLLFSFFILLGGSSAHGQAIPLESVSFELLHTFPNGNGNGELGYYDTSRWSEPDPIGPPDFAIDENCQFLIWDYRNRRLVVFDDAFTFIQSKPFSNSWGGRAVDIWPDGVLLSSSEAYVMAFKIGKTSISEIALVLSSDLPIPNKRVSSYGYVYAAGLLISEYSNNYQVLSLEIRENRQPLFRNYGETLQYIRSNQVQGVGLWADERGFLWYNDRLFTKNSRTFVDFWFKYSGRSMNYNEELVGPVYRGGTYAGVDRDGNYYWDVFIRQTYSRLFIFNKKGQLIRYFEFDPDSYPRTPLNVDLEGNVYFMQHTPQGHTLYRLERTWGTFSETTPGSSARYATSTESRVRVRAAANLHGQTLGHLEKGERVEVLEQSGQKVRVGEMEDYWYRVRRLSDGLTGWAYGYFLKREP